MDILTRNTSARVVGVKSDFRALYNAHPQFIGKIKRSIHGHYIDLNGRRCEMFMHGDYKYLCLKKGKYTMILNKVYTQYCHSYKFTSRSGGILCLLKCEYVFVDDDFCLDMSTIMYCGCRPFYNKVPGLYIDTPEYYIFDVVNDWLNMSDPPAIMPIVAGYCNYEKFV
jgi:hypothetical protein